MENEEVPSAPSTPATPGTPGAPLFGGFKAERSGNGRRSLLKNCKCFSAEEWAMEEGTLPKLSCSLPPPPVPLAKKVHFYLSHKLNPYFCFCLENYYETVFRESVNTISRYCEVIVFVLYIFHESINDKRWIFYVKSE